MGVGWWKYTYSHKHLKSILSTVSFFANFANMSDSCILNTANPRVLQDQSLKCGFSNIICVMTGIGTYIHLIKSTHARLSLSFMCTIPCIHCSIILIPKLISKLRKYVQNIWTGTRGHRDTCITMSLWLIINMSLTLCISCAWYMCMSYYFNRTQNKQLGRAVNFCLRHNPIPV